MGRFGSTPVGTLGVEEELQILDPDSLGLAPGVDTILQEVRPLDRDRVATELFRCMVETIVGPVPDVTEARERVRRLRARVADAAEVRGLQVAAAGTHPFSRWDDREVTPEDRYEDVLEGLRFLGGIEVMFGHHVHVSVGSRGRAIRVHDHLRPLLPLLLACSANSPLWKGEDPGFRSTRMLGLDLAALPHAGMPPAFGSWDAFRASVDRLRAVGAVDTVSDLWWDVRPRPDLGTVEVRICDVPTDVDLGLEIAALVQALVVHLHRHDGDGSRPLPTASHTLVEEGRFRAMRDGADAVLPVQGPAGVRTVPVPELLGEVVEALDPVARDLGTRRELAALRKRVRNRRTGARRQRRVLERTGDLRTVVADVAHRTRP